MEAGTNTAKGKLIEKIMNQLILTQLILHPTRQKNILDLVLTNNSKLINNIIITPTIHSDHNIINISTNILLEETNYHQKSNILFSDKSEQNEMGNGKPHTKPS